MTDRLIFAAALAAILTLVLGRWGIPFLTRFHVAQRIREEAPTQHRGKAGTPTMGGLLLIPAAAIAAVLAAPHHGWRLLLPLAAMVAYGAVGGLDDALAIRHRRNLGLRARRWRLPWRARARDLPGSTRIPPRSSWATLAPTRWVPFWPGWPLSRKPNGCSSSSGLSSCWRPPRSRCRWCTLKPRGAGGFSG